MLIAMENKSQKWLGITPDVCYAIYTGRFLTLSTNLQYQNQKRIAAKKSLFFRTFSM